MTGAEIRSLLPWRGPFVFVDGLEECVPHLRAVTFKRIAADEPLRGFLPPVLVLEGLSQTAALLFQLSYGRIEPPRMPLLGHLEASLHAGGHAGDTIRYTVEAVKMTSTQGIFRGAARVEGSLLVEAELGFAVSESLP